MSKLDDALTRQEAAISLTVYAMGEAAAKERSDTIDRLVAFLEMWEGLLPRPAHIELLNYVRELKAKNNK